MVRVVGIEFFVGRVLLVVLLLVGLQSGVHAEDGGCYVIEPYLHAATDSDFKDTEVVAEAVRWLGTIVPGARISVSEFRTLRTSWEHGSETEVVGAMTSTGVNRQVGACRRIAVFYVPDYPAKVMGRAWHFENGNAFILMNTQRLGFRASASGKAARNVQVLKHEFVHAIGFVPAADHLLLDRGRHCAAPSCLIFANVRFIDILAYLFPEPYALDQPTDLCYYCRRDLGLNPGDAPPRLLATYNALPVTYFR